MRERKRFDGFSFHNKIYLSLRFTYIFVYIFSMSILLLFPPNFSCFQYRKRDTRVSCLTMKKVPFLRVFAVAYGGTGHNGSGPGIVSSK